jgi:hypothetical protein
MIFEENSLVFLVPGGIRICKRFNEEVFCKNLTRGEGESKDSVLACKFNENSSSEVLQLRTSATLFVVKETLSMSAPFLQLEWLRIE